MAAIKDFALPYTRSRKLVQAIVKGDMDYVTSVVPESVNVNQAIESYPGSPSTHLSMLAVANNSIDMLEYFMDMGADALVRDRVGMNLFSKVASTPRLDKRITDTLFFQDNDGEHLNDQSINGNTVVHAAVLAKNVYTLSALLNMSSVIRVATIRNSKGDTPLALAIKTAGGNPTIPMMLINYATDVTQEPLSTTDARGNTAMDIAFALDMPGVVEAIRAANCALRVNKQQYAQHWCIPRGASHRSVSVKSESERERESISGMSIESFIYDEPDPRRVDETPAAPEPEATSAIVTEMLSLHETNAKLTAINESTQKRIDDLEQLLVDKEDELTNCREDNTITRDSMMATIDDYNDRIQEYIRRVAELESTESDRLSAIASLTSDLRDMTDQRDALVSETERIKNTNQALLTQAEGKQAKVISELTEQLSDMRLDTTKLRDDNNTMADINRKLGAELEDAISTASVEREKCRLDMEKCRVKVDIITGANAQLTEEIEQLKPLEKQVDDLNARLQTAASDLERQITINDGLKQTISDTESDAVAKISNLKALVKNQRDIIGQQRFDAKQAEDEFHATTQELIDTKDRLKSLTDIKQKLERDLTRLKSGTGEVTEQIEKKLSDALGREDALVGKLGQMKADTINLCRNKDIEIENLTSALDKIKADLSQTNATNAAIITNNNKQIEDLYIQIAEMTATTGSLRSEILEQKQRNDQLFREIEATKITLASQQSRMEAEKGVYAGLLNETSNKLEASKQQYEAQILNDRERYETYVKKKEQKEAELQRRIATLEEQVTSLNAECAAELTENQNRHSATIEVMKSDFARERAELQMAIDQARREEYEKNYATVVASEEARKIATSELQAAKAEAQEAQRHLMACKADIVDKDKRIARIMRDTGHLSSMVSNRSVSRF